MRSVIRGIGSYLPHRIVKNVDLERDIETSDAWIVQRTGIHQRHIADDSETTASLGEQAARKALENAGLHIHDIDFIILATTTPDNTFPATAVEIQKRLGMRHGFAFDVQAVCTGFIYALTTADFYLQAGRGKHALVIGAETFSRIVDWKDRSTCVLFGDGAGAVILESVKKEDTRGRGILASSLRSDGNHKEKLFVDGGPSTSESVGKVRMQGKEVFRHAVNMITDVIYEVFAQSGIKAKDIDWFVPHQANKRIIELSAQKLGIEKEKIVITVDLHANTCAASIPLALSMAFYDGRIKKNDLVLLEAMGGGFTWGALLLRW